MNRGLRQCHGQVFTALGVLLPVALVVGLAARPPVPAGDTLSPALAVAQPTYQLVEWYGVDLFAKKSPIRVQLLRERTNSGSFALKCTAGNDFQWPDLLVYWIAGNQTVSNSLPDQAILLGGFGPTPLPLPDEVVRSPGMFVLYSLANREIIDVSRAVSLDQPAIKQP